MQHYLNKAIIWDFLIALIVVVCIIVFDIDKSQIIADLETDNINNFIISCISVSATLIGFLLTIITVIVTFKNSFKSDSLNESKVESNIFDKKLSKEERFYNTDIHKHVTDVFVGSSIEIAIVLLSLLLIQFNLLNFKNEVLAIVSLLAFLLITLSLFRSFYIFKYFLKVHIHNTK